MQGLLLINLGTPAAPTTPAVRRYLRQFLTDPRVIDIHPVGRGLLVYGVILPFRPRRSAAAYREIWTDRGSPLLFHGQDLADAVRARLGDGWRVALGMRYGQPSIAAAVDALRAGGVDHIVAMPLYPQYASSSTASSLDELFRVLSRGAVVPPVSVIGDFYDDPGFIEATRAIAAPALADFGADHVLFSFHGLPVRQVRATDPTGAHCHVVDGCCDRIVPANRKCYRAQSFATARALGAALGLPDGGWSVAFQSRLGRTPWIQPYTDQELPRLAREGKRRLAVLVPSFVADCLETTEEIGIRGKALFEEAGGDALCLIPCVNASAPWADAVAALATRAAPSRVSPG